MKIVFTGGGTGGHFYPVIAVAEQVNKLADEQKIANKKLYYFSDSPYDKALLFENSMAFVAIPAGKRRLYSSFKNFTDNFKIISGIFTALFRLFILYPDVVFGKGGYASFPTLAAARLLRIPVVIHESDSIPGRVNLWAGKFAKAIGISYDEAVTYFPNERTAWTGQPIRESLLKKESVNGGAFEFFKLDPTVPTVFIVGGSQGAEIINNTLLDNLPAIVDKYQVIHQAGPANIEAIKSRASVVLEKSQNKNRYYVAGTLDATTGMKMAFAAATIVVSRAGSTIFEIANWGIPSIIIPISSRVSHDQEHNAFNYARAGACDVIEEPNLTPSVLFSEIDRLMKDRPRREEMSKKAQAFAKPDAARVIAEKIIGIALSHER